MKRDMDLVRDILTRVEDDANLDGSRFMAFGPAEFPGHTQEEIAYHVDLLLEHGLALGLRSNDAPTAEISRLTWEGHEFVADTRDAGVWASVKEQIKGLPSVGFAIAWELAKAELKKRLKLQ